MKFLKFSFALLLSSVSIASVANAITPQQVYELQHGPGNESGREFSDSMFILPNEPHFARFASAMRNLEGTFIGVGTFRVLAAASYGRFNQVIFADLDQATVDFNRKQIDVLARSARLPEFLSGLLERPELTDEIAESLRAERYISSSSKTPLAQALLGSNKLECLYVHSLMSMAIEDQSRSFLTSESAFTHLHDLARKGRMHALAADLSGSRTYRALARLLRKEGSKVGALDVSNAPDYLHHSKEAWSNYLANLRALPFSSLAVINSTNRYHTRVRAATIPWVYDSTPAETYQQLGAKVQYGSSYEMTDFVADLAKQNAVRACRDLFR